MYIAKPNDRNFVDAKAFDLITEAKEYLDEYIKPDFKMGFEDWIALEKLLEVEGSVDFKNIDASVLRQPQFFPKTENGILKSKRFDIADFL